MRGKEFSTGVLPTEKYYSDKHRISAVGHIRPMCASGSGVGIYGYVCFASTDRASTGGGGSGSSRVAAGDSVLSSVGDVAHDGLDYIRSEPKRPVRPSSGPDGTDGIPERTPGTDGYLGVRPEDYGRGLQVSQIAESPLRLHVTGVA